MLDQMAKRYGRMPHELIELEFGEFLFDLRAVEAGLQFQKELEAQEEARRRR